MAMLKNTLILPVDSDVLAAQLLRNAIADLDVILMLVLGRGEPVEEIVSIADQLADKGSFGIGNFRRVVWIPVLHSSVVDVLSAIFQEAGVTDPPLVAVLNFHDVLKATLTADDFIDPIVLEKAFIEGNKL